MLAAKYLAQPGFQLVQVAGLLGYTEQSALNRSCRRWFGTTPRQYRVQSGRTAAAPATGSMVGSRKTPLARGKRP